MSDLPESLNRARAAAFSDRPAWEALQNQRPPRPMPRQMRPPAQRANDPRLAQSERDRALRQFDRSNAVNVDTYQRQAFGQRNQVAEAASMAAESTGLPAIRRAGSDLTRWGAYTAGTEQGNDDLASGALNLGAGSLGVLGMAGMVPRAPMRGALRPPVTAPEVAPPRITRPPTEIAPNGMPIAPPRPFRNSLRGGSSDLMDAAGMMAPPRTARPPAQAPDAGGGRGGQDLSDFDTDQVWTRAVKGGVDPFEVQPAPGNTMGPGLYFGSDDIVGRAARRIGDDAAVHGAYIRNGKTASYQQWRQAYERAEKGPFGARSAAETERRAVADLERQGYIGVYRRHNHDGSAEINVFRRENVVGVPQESPALSPSPDVGNAGGGRVVYRGLNRPYDPANGGYYQSFTSSLDDAREYGPNVIAANINPGRNLAIDGGGNNFNALSVEQLPADIRAKLHPSVGQSATTDQIAHAAREAGYDSVTVRNVHDNRWGERPARGAEPRTIDFVFDTRNVSPLDQIPAQQSSAAAATEKVKLSAADRALLDELFADDPPARSNAGPQK